MFDLTDIWVATVDLDRIRKEYHAAKNA